MPAIWRNLSKTVLLIACFVALREYSILITDQSGMTRKRIELRMPELGLNEISLRVSGWMKQIGDEVIEGENVVEIVAGEVAIDLPSPENGVLSEQLVEEDDRVKTGQLLTYIDGSDAI